MSKNKIIDIALIALVFLFCVAFPIDLFTKNMYVIRSVQIGLRIAAIIFTIIFAIKSKNLEMKKEGFRLIPLLLLIPTLLACINNLIYVWYEKYPFKIHFDNLVLLEIVLTVFVAISEELIFRKVIFDNLEMKNNLLKIIIAAGIFGLFHIVTFFSTFNPIDLLQVVYCFGLGIVLGFIYSYGKSIVFAIIFHFLFNLINTNIFQNIEGIDIKISFYIISIIVSAIVGLILLIEYLLYFKKDTESNV